MNRIRRAIKGYLQIKLSGAASERFLNLCAKRRISLWKICKRNEFCEMCIDAVDFKKLHCIVRKTKSRIRIEKKIGFPFWRKHLWKKSFFLTGMIFSISFWWFSQAFLWEITWEGNCQVTDDRLESYLAQKNVHTGKLLNEIPLTDLEKALRKDFPEIVWTSVTAKGTELHIAIRENDTVSRYRDHIEHWNSGANGKTEYRNTGNGFAVSDSSNNYAAAGSSIESPCDGVISSMIVRSGTPRVRIGDRVQAGEILVDGRVPVMAEDGSVREMLLVFPDADIYVEHSMCYEDRLPAIYAEPVKTGRTQKEISLQIGKLSLKNPFCKEFLRKITLQSDLTPEWIRNLGISFSIWQTESIEYMDIRVLHTREQAEELLSEAFLQFLKTLEEKGVQIIEKDVKIDAEGLYWLATGKLKVREKAKTP